MRHVLELHIVDITALAGQEPGVFDASRRIADFEFCHAWPPRIEEITRGGEVANALFKPRMTIVLAVSPKPPILAPCYESSRSR